jgi:hypothetical protein
MPSAPRTAEGTQAEFRGSFDSICRKRAFAMSEQFESARDSGRWDKLIGQDLVRQVHSLNDGFRFVRFGDAPKRMLAGVLGLFYVVTNDPSGYAKFVGQRGCVRAAVLNRQQSAVDSPSCRGGERIVGRRDSSVSSMRPTMASGSRMSTTMTA